MIIILGYVEKCSNGSGENRPSSPENSAISEEIVEN